MDRLDDSWTNGLNCLVKMKKGSIFLIIMEYKNETEECGF